MTMNQNKYNFQTLTDSQARELLARFEAGDTSLAEEEALYGFFHRPKLPADLEPLRPLMAWYENGCHGEPALPDEARKEEKKPAGKRIRFMRAFAVAASLAIIIATAVTLFLRDNPAAPGNDFEDIYAGSYIISNNVKITDPEKIRDKVLRMEALQDSVNNLIAKASLPPDSLYYLAADREFRDSPTAREVIARQMQEEQTVIN